MAFYNRIRSIADAVGYVKLKMGGGINNVELTDDAIRQNIIDTYQNFTRYMCGESTYEDYIVFNLKEGVSRYQLPNEITDVFEFSQSTGGSATMNGMSPSAFRSSGVGGFSGINSSSSSFINGSSLYGDSSGIRGNDAQVGLGLSGWVINAQTQADMAHFFSSQFMVQFHRLRGEMVVTPTPKSDVTGVMGVWRKETLENSLDHIHCKALMVAMCKIQWGNIVGKYQITLAGGGTISGSEMVSQGTDEQEKALNAMKDEREPLGLYIG